MSYILTFNAGSSSLKLGLYQSTDDLQLVAQATVENIGHAPASFWSMVPSGEQTPAVSITARTHDEAMRYLEKWLHQYITSPQDILAVGHRIVHGGSLYYRATLISSRVLSDLNDLRDIDPDHMPAALESIAALQSSYPHAPHIACFDTAFYRDLPPVAQRLPLPRSLHDKGLRRYGFHGLSYGYLLHDFYTHEGSVAARGRIVMAHLGSGSSLCAIKNGKPVDTTMGFTPAGGIPMSTRSGDIDPGVMWYLHRTIGQSPEQFNTMVNTQSGLLGVSGKTADMRELLRLQGDNSHAAEAIELYCYSITKAIGALSASVGGLDSLIFSGGIGERSAEIRERICQNFDYLGIRLNPARNTANERLISEDGAPVGVHVIPTDESQMIASETYRVILGRN